MREIKFRAWDGEQDRYFYFFIGQGSGCFQETYDRLCLNGIHFEQFTGLRDKNGKEIYEGDIVAWGKTKYKVYFESGRFCLDMAGDEYWAECTADISVTGNIHEPPELLK